MAMAGTRRQGDAPEEAEQATGGPPPGMGKVGWVGGRMTCRLHL
jgi:hypothetical protein